MMLNLEIKQKEEMTINQALAYHNFVGTFRANDFEFPCRIFGEAKSADFSAWKVYVGKGVYIYILNDSTSLHIVWSSSKRRFETGELSRSVFDIPLERLIQYAPKQITEFLFRGREEGIKLDRTLKWFETLNPYFCENKERYDYLKQRLDVPPYNLTKKFVEGLYREFGVNGTTISIDYSPVQFAIGIALKATFSEEYANGEDSEFYKEALVAEERLESYNPTYSHFWDIE